MLLNTHMIKKNPFVENKCSSWLHIHLKGFVLPQATFIVNATKERRKHRAQVSAQKNDDKEAVSFPYTNDGFVKFWTFLTVHALTISISKSSG